MTMPQIADHIVQEINKNLGTIRTAKSEKYDEFAKEKIKVLVDVLDLVDEVKDDAELAEKVKLLFRGRQGALDGLNDLLQVIGRK